MEDYLDRRIQLNFSMLTLKLLIFSPVEWYGWGSNYKSYKIKK